MRKRLRKYTGLQRRWISGQALLPTGAVQTATITAVNYGTNTITLDTPLSWADNDEVGLYEDSDGTRIFYGNAPDMGAVEYSSTPEATNVVTGAVISGGVVLE